MRKYFSILLSGLILFGVCSLNAQGYNYACSVIPGGTKTVGIVTDLKIAQCTLTKDLQLNNPMTNQATPGFGQLENVSWSGGVGDPISLTFWCSQSNVMAIKAAQQSTLTNTNVSVAFSVFEYDQVMKQWFVGMNGIDGKTGKDLMGSLQVAGSSVRLNVDMTVPNANHCYKVSLTMVPLTNTSSVINVATSPTQKLVKTWGLLVVK